MLPKNFTIDPTLRDSLEITGKIFNNLTCISVAGFSLEGDLQKRRTCYLFNCSCGNSLIVRGKDVVSEKIKSCGCLRKATAAENGKANKKSIPNDRPAFLRYFSTYKVGAKKRGLGFSLDEDQFRNITEKSCHYCGLPPSKEHAKN